MMESTVGSATGCADSSAGFSVEDFVALASDGAVGCAVESTTMAPETFSVLVDVMFSISTGKGKLVF